MKRVLVAGSVVAVGDGTLLGTALALGWTTATVVALAAGIVGAVAVALLTPPPRVADEHATVTLGLPVQEPEAREEALSRAGERPQANDAPKAPIGPAPSPVAA
jgi:hypothetical protein